MKQEIQKNCNMEEPQKASYLSRAGRVVAVGAIVGFSMIGPTTKASDLSSTEMSKLDNATTIIVEDLGCWLIVICGVNEVV